MMHDTPPTVATTQSSWRREALELARAADTTRRGRIVACLLLLACAGVVAVAAFSPWEISEAFADKNGLELGTGQVTLAVAGVSSVLALIRLAGRGPQHRRSPR